jgi:hypothetical protein
VELSLFPQKGDSTSISPDSHTKVFSQGKIRCLYSTDLCERLSLGKIQHFIPPTGGVELLIFLQERLSVLARPKENPLLRQTMAHFTYCGFLSKKLYSNHRISKTRGKVVPFDMVMLPVVPHTSRLKSLVEIVRAILKLQPETWVFLNKIFTHCNGFGLWQLFQFKHRQTRRFVRVQVFRKQNQL